MIINNCVAEVLRKLFTSWLPIKVDVSSKIANSLPSNAELNLPRNKSIYSDIVK